jgi:hypothetical protein
MVRLRWHYHTYSHSHSLLQKLGRRRIEIRQRICGRKIGEKVQGAFFNPRGHHILEKPNTNLEEETEECFRREEKRIHLFIFTFCK